jgi:hypothetical protein
MMQNLFYAPAISDALPGTASLRALRAILVTNTVTIIVATMPNQKNT